MGFGREAKSAPAQLIRGPRGTFDKFCQKSTVTDPAPMFHCPWLTNPFHSMDIVCGTVVRTNGYLY
jgi:hypothetical protein